MFNAADIRAASASASAQLKAAAEEKQKELEERKSKIDSWADQLIEKKISPAVNAAASEGVMALAIMLPSCDGEVAHIAFEKLARAGFDVAVSLDTSNAEEKGQICFTLYWSKDRGEGDGNVTEPKRVTLD